MFQLAISRFSVGEVSNQVVCGKFVENPRVQNPDCDVVDSDIGALQDEEAIMHDSKAHIGF